MCVHAVNMQTCPCVRAFFVHLFFCTALSVRKSLHKCVCFSVKHTVSSSARCEYNITLLDLVIVAGSVGPNLHGGLPGNSDPKSSFFF